MEPEPDERECPFLARRLAESDELLDLAEAAERLGISVKRLCGWEPTTHYTYERGRLASSIPETEWDEQERAYMLALALYRRTRCGHCGGDLTETTAAANEGRYRPLLPVQCHRCVALGQSEKAYHDHAYPLALMHRVELRRG